MAISAVYTRGETNEGKRPSWANYGPEIEVTAPGSCVYTTSQNDLDEDGKLNDFYDYEGTSFSTPIVAGEAAQVYQMLTRTFGSNPSISAVKGFIKYHCDPGGPTYDRQNDDYGHGIIDSWETLTFATVDDFEDGNTNSWSEHYMTEASYPNFDVTTHYGPSPYPSGVKRGILYMQDTTGDKAVIYKWETLGNQLLKVDSTYDKYYSYYTKRSNGYMWAYHDFYPVLQDSNNFIRVRFIDKYLRVYKMYQGTLTQLYEENVYSHTGHWGYDWQQVEIHIYTVWYYYTYFLGMVVKRKAEGSTYTSPPIWFAGPYSWGTTYMQGPIAIGFRGGWSSGNYGYAYWDLIRVAEVPLLS
jgi:hypothetical protein